MANYPTSDPSFSGKSAGQTISATHINALQDEVVAIGSALRGTLTHAVTTSQGIVATGGLAVGGNSTLTGGLQAGASSLASLVVAGGSTLATLQVSGGSTFAGAVTFSGSVTLPSTQTFSVSAAKVTLSANAALANNTETGISWDVQTVATSGMHSTASNSSRLTFPSTGLYAVGAHTIFTLQASGGIRLRVRSNDTTTVLFANDAPAALGTYPLAVNGFVRVSDTTTYLTVSCWQQTGSTGSLAFNSTQGETSFWAYKVTNTVA